MSKDELMQRINELEQAIEKSDSRKLKRDYGKRIRCLYYQLKFYDKLKTGDANG